VAAENDNTTNRFEVDGVAYEVPLHTDLTVDDWNIVYDMCEVVWMDFAAEIDDQAAEKERLKRLRNPRLQQAFLMVGYLRVHPEDTIETAREVTGRARLIALIEAENRTDDDEEDPTQASPTPISASSRRSKPATKGSSSAASTKNSDEQDDEPKATGTGG